MSERRAVISTEQKCITDFLQASGRPTRSSAKKAVLNTEGVTSSRKKTIIKPYRDKPQCSVSSTTKSKTLPVTERDHDYDFSPTKRPLLPENVPNESSTKTEPSNIASPMKRLRDSLAKPRETRSSARKVSSDKIGKKIDTPNKSNVNLNSEQCKEKLKDCKSWLEIKQQVLKINNAAEKVKQFKSMKITTVQSPVKPVKLPPHLKNLTPEKLAVAHLSPFGEKWSVSPSKFSPRKITKFVSSVNPSKSSVVKRLFDDDNNNEDSVGDKNKDSSSIPAYKRYGHLLKTSDSDSSSLQLPFSYQNIYELFKIVDQLVLTLSKRTQLCTFKKLKEMVEPYTRKAFNISDLVRLQTVGQFDDFNWFKLSYTFHQEEKQLAIASNIGEQLKCINTATILLERQERFRSILVDRVKKYHLEFLASLDIALDVSQKLFKWHPMFKLENVPQIEPNNELLPKKYSQSTSHNRNSILNYIVFREDSKKTVVQDDDKTIVKCESIQEISSTTIVDVKATDKVSAIKKLPAGKDDKFKALLEKVNF